MEERTREITLLLERWSGGERAALEQVTELLYAQLRTLAGSYLRRERSDHTLQPTALIHEVYLRMANLGESSFDNRQQFMALSAQMMRRILVDHARRAHSAKRGAGVKRVPVSDALNYGPDRAAEFLVLDDALTRLAAFSERQARVIELRYFAGLNVEEVGEVLGISAPTVSRAQRMAEAWLSGALAS